MCKPSQDQQNHLANQQLTENPMGKSTTPSLNQLNLSDLWLNERLMSYATEVCVGLYYTALLLAVDNCYRCYLAQPSHITKDETKDGSGHAGVLPTSYH